MLKNILLPALIACGIAGPVIYSKSQNLPPTTGANDSNAGGYDFYNQQNFHQRTAGNEVASAFSPFQPVAPVQISPSMSPGQQVAGSQAIYSNLAALPNLVTLPNAGTLPNVGTPARPVAAGAQGFLLPPGGSGVTMPASVAATRAAASGTVVSSANSIPGNGINHAASAWSGQPIAGMAPDYAAAQTTLYPGDINGPDLTAEPLSFIPINDFREVFRFNVTPQWIKQRFDRISNLPPQDGLHGLRTALVTGTNTWDLHGSQTWFFDTSKRLQRLTFRGWVGDPSRLLQVATGHFGLRPQQTHWAGLYVGQFNGKTTGGLLMKDPDVIDQRNSVQRTAVLMEINLPTGEYEISDEFRAMMMTAAAK